VCVNAIVTAPCGGVAQCDTSLSKVNRNLGKAYVSRATGENVEARAVGPPCRDGCHGKVTRPVIDKIFSEFWNIGDHDLQNADKKKCAM